MTFLILFGGVSYGVGGAVTLLRDGIVGSSTGATELKSIQVR